MRKGLDLGECLGRREHKYNALVIWYTISYDLSTQLVGYTLRPSRSFANVVEYTWFSKRNQILDSLDLYGIYSIAEVLPDECVG